MNYALGRLTVFISVLYVKKLILKEYAKNIWS